MVCSAQIHVRVSLTTKLQKNWVRGYHTRGRFAILEVSAGEGFILTLYQLNPISTPITPSVIPIHLFLSKRIFLNILGTILKLGILPTGRLNPCTNSV